MNIIDYIKYRLTEVFKHNALTVLMFIVILTLCVLAGTAHADRVDDMDKMDPSQACGVRATFVFAGMVTRVEGRNPDTEINEAEAESIAGNPSFTPFTDRERGYLLEHYALGARMVEGFKENAGRWPTKEEMYEQSQRLFAECAARSHEGMSPGIDVNYINTATQPDRADQVRALPVIKYCEYIAVLYATGIDARNNGRPLLFKHVDKPADGRVIGGSAPLDGIYLYGLDQFTTNEAMFALKHITAGWTYADDQYGSGLPMPANKWMSGAMDYMADCMHEKGGV